MWSLPLIFQGAKIRGTYVKWAAGEKKRLEDELNSKRSEVAEKERLVNEARGEYGDSMCLIHVLIQNSCA
jgi:hypothetical protein